MSRASVHVDASGTDSVGSDPIRHPEQVAPGFRPRRQRRYSPLTMSTRRLIILSLLCGVAILVAFMVQLLVVM